MAEECCSYVSLAVDNGLDIAVSSSYVSTSTSAICEIRASGAIFWFHIGNKASKTDILV